MNAEMRNTVSTLTLKRLRPVFLAVLVVACIAGLVARSGANAASSEVERAVDYTAPSGPELDPLAAARTVASRYARQAGQDGALDVAVARGSFAEATAVTEGKVPSEAETESSSPEIAAWRTSRAYLIVIKALAANARFTPNVPTPRGHNGPSGAVMSLIIDSHTGFVEGETIGPSAPKIDELGSVVSTTIAAVGAETSDLHLSAAASSPRPGLLIGRAYVGRRAAKGWPVLVARSRGGLARHAITATRTGSTGGFTIPLTAGLYVIAVRRPNGRECGVREVRIVHHARTHVALRCSR